MPMNERGVLTAMTFNVRYGSADAGTPRSWRARRARVEAVLADHRPDVLATQETLSFQRDDLRRALAGHEVIAAGRDDGAESGEMTALFYDAQRFVCRSSGHFWLSETPELPGSVGWDAELPRVVTWARLEDRDGSLRVVVNAHLDHRGVRARRESAHLLRRRVAELRAGSPAILLGDFNCPADGEVHRLLVDGGTDGWIDVFEAMDREPGGTFHDFTGDAGAGPARRFDWILTTEPLRVLEASVDREERAGGYPSDHFPVLARLAEGVSGER